LQGSHLGHALGLRLQRLLSADESPSQPGQAAVATARVIARVYCRMVTYKIEYQPANMEAYQQKYRHQQVKSLQRTAAR